VLLITILFQFHAELFLDILCGLSPATRTILKFLDAREEVSAVLIGVFARSIGVSARVSLGAIME
jgi:hypothetical protein